MSTVITEIQGTGIVLPGADIDTDQIIPARFLKEISFEKMGDYLFYDQRFDDQNQPKKHPLNDPAFKSGSILIVGQNFGCGSSREHAPQAIKRYGIQAVIGESFAEIFAGNAKAIGLVLVQVEPSVLKALTTHVNTNPDQALRIDLQSLKLQLTHSQHYQIRMKEDHRSAFLTGTWDILSLLKENTDKINALAKRLASQ